MFYIIREKKGVNFFNCSFSKWMVFVAQDKYITEENLQLFGLPYINIKPGMYN